jgi:hypothetical protein
VTKERASGPRLLVGQTSRSRGATAGQWLVAWNIENRDRKPIQILAGRLPHSQFWSEEKELSPKIKLLPNQSAELEFSVRCSEPPETVVENAFLILRVLWPEEPWRIFARLRVLFDEQGGPQTTTELVTAQPTGFSGGKRQPK